jgi:hypothetical protein
MMRPDTIMRVEISADNDAIADQVDQLSRFYLVGLEESVDSISVVVDEQRDTLGKPLLRCRVLGRLSHGEPLEVVETQADTVLAITRALDRTVRTLRRRCTLSRLARSA